MYHHQNHTEIYGVTPCLTHSLGDSFSLKPITEMHGILSQKCMVFLPCNHRSRVTLQHTHIFRIISSTNFNAQFLFINNMFVTLLSSTCFEH